MNEKHTSSKPKKVAITGANGFVGSFLVHYFAKSHYDVLAFSRNPVSFGYSNVKEFQYSLQTGFSDNSVLKDCDLLVHCAYEKYSPQTPSAFFSNVEGARMLSETARQQQVRKIVFLSSFSSQPDALNNYGKAKFEAEKFFNPTTDLILRPGLILGNGGLFKSICEVVAKSPFVPLPDGGKQKIQTLYIADLAKVIERSLIENLSGTYYIAHPEILTLRELNRMIAQKAGRKFRYVNIPITLLMVATRTAEKLKIPLSISSENLLGLKKSAVFDTQPLLEKLNFPFKNTRESLDLLFLQKGFGNS